MVAVCAVAVLAAAALTPSQAEAAFGFKSLDVAFTEEDGSAADRAGSHPFAWTTTLTLNTEPGPGPKEIPEQALKDLRIQLPPGLVGTPALLPRCSHAEFLAQACPPGTAVGTVELETSAEETEGTPYPVYNLLPHPGNAAELGFTAVSVPVTIEVGINPRPPYNLIAALTNASQVALFYGTKLSIRGFSGETPFLTLPRSCGVPLASVFEADSWQEPGSWVSGASQTLGLEGCAELAFSPELSAAPTSEVAESPSGFELRLDGDTEGFVKSGVPPQSEVREASIQLADGIAVNPAVAAGLGSCGPDDMARETPASVTAEGCPESSKVGTALVETPLFEAPLTGSVYVARPDDRVTSRRGAENPFDSLLALYLVVKSPERGVLVTQAVKVEPDSGTGQLAIRLEEMPQLPISHLELHFREGPRSPLRNPATCGRYANRYQLAPWSGASPVDATVDFTIDHGCAAEEFAPHLTAGTVHRRAGAASPFVIDIGRRDREENLSKVTLVLPRGLSAKFAGVRFCPDAQAAGGKCPATSRLGSAHVAVGSGAAPLWLSSGAGDGAGVFLAGPYRGAPFSLVVAIPAKAGPFDLGTVAVRGAIDFDHDTAQARVDLDPLPQIIEGVPIDYRVIHLELDRPGFIRNPTSCERLSVNGRLTSSGGRVARPSELFQAAGCGNLGFQPRFSLRLGGSVHRGAHPELRAALATRGGDANVRRFMLSLPPTELLDVKHIRGVCAAADFSAGACPAGSVYGQATAWSPLLDEPLRGPVYLRSSKSRLPDLVASLDGQVSLDLTARLDTAQGRVRATFEGLPDLPLRKFVLTLRGGKRSLFVNSGGLCAEPRRALARVRAQNGRTRHFSSPVKTECPSFRDTAVPPRPLP
ncbi:MAG TPA: hypothetical protein VKB23_10450 [Solirubrobacterales bacterium]|nr:hypothetical protein [Solirubrobacterales bacterium]